MRFESHLVSGEDPRELADALFNRMLLLRCQTSRDTASERALYQRLHQLTCESNARIRNMNLQVQNKVFGLVTQISSRKRAEK